MTHPIKNWKKEARVIISKVCCDGQYVNESITFIQQLLSEATCEAMEKAKKYMDEVDYENYKNGFKDPITPFNPHKRD